MQRVKKIKQYFCDCFYCVGDWEVYRKLRSRHRNKDRKHNKREVEKEVESLLDK